MRLSYVPKTAGSTELPDYIEANVIYGQGKEQEIYAISNTLAATIPFLPLNARA